MSSFNYKCGQGETWTSISYKMYGNISGVVNLIEANPKIPIDTILPFGTILIIPILDNTDSSIITENIPLWK